ncbi:DUF7657 domain-containing protein [Gryllotalpicola koreensis]|uniref:DUF7657 domain-containing protein n=1 Tax=Gryllotalpicola koreensis TaxID=993086 RepID=UPI0031D51711
MLKIADAAPRAPWGARLGAWLAPQASGLPNLLVLVAFPALAFVILGVLVALGISGSSTGAHWAEFGSGADPSLLAGVPRPIRSDEWFVQSSWIVSQIREGFPSFNQTLPGGMDATVQNDLPSWDWSTIFRPHVAGFLFLPLDQGMALRWWLPAFGVLVGVYWFVVSILPRRPILAAMLAVATLFSPILQWWFLPTTLWPVAWAFLVMTAVVFALRAGHWWVRAVVAALAGYVTVTMAMSIYVPFIVPAAVAAGLFAIGAVLQSRFTRGLAWHDVLVRLVPLASAAVGAVAVLGAWVATRLPTIRAVLGTVYPGQRLEATGGGGLQAAIALFSGPFQSALGLGAWDGIGPNPSEASAPLVLSLLLTLPLVLLLVLLWRRAHRIDWPAAATLVGGLVVLAFLFVPHWDALAYLLLLDRTTDGRIRLAFAVLAVMAVTDMVRMTEGSDGLIVSRRLRLRLHGAVAAACGVVAMVPSGVVWLYLRHTGSAVVHVTHLWAAVVLLTGVAVALYCLGRSGWATAAFLMASLAVGGMVNPVYRGVYDVADDTRAGHAVEAIGKADPDAVWVGVGGNVTTSVLLESGVKAMNGVQTYPPRTLWAEIDPAKRYEDAWNRLANISWTPGTGEPVVSNPVRDQIAVTFDSCSSFAKSNVDYVLSTGAIQQSCLTQEAKITQGATTLWIYREG